MTITDEMVEKSIRAFNDQTVAWDAGAVPQDSMRAALEAVAPALIAQGMREAFQILTGGDDYADMLPIICQPAKAIWARAQELDPQPQSYRRGDTWYDMKKNEYWGYDGTKWVRRAQELDPKYPLGSPL